MWMAARLQICNRINDNGPLLGTEDSVKKAVYFRLQKQIGYGCQVSVVLVDGTRVR